jgi:hypothetical protein
VYGERYVRKDITKEEYDEYLAQSKAAGNSSATGEYYTWERTPNFMGVVRPDNSFEFTGISYAQGDHYFLSRCSQGFFNTDSRRGGMLYRHGEKMYPIYRGMRVDCETMRPLDKDIVITGRKVNRKEGKDLLKQYVDFYKICEVMCKSMDGKTFEETATAIYNEYKATDEAGLNIKTEVAFALADSLIHQAPFDALILYSLALDVYGIRWVVRNGGNHPYHSDVFPMNAFEAAKRKLNKYLYSQNKNVFKPVQYAMGEHLPASEWGYTITVGGKEVTQY